jgi:GTPase SAR1 family protein
MHLAEAGEMAAVGSMARTCRALRAACDQENLWERLYERVFVYPAVEVEPCEPRYTSWKNRFVQTWRVTRNQKPDPVGPSFWTRAARMLPFASKPQVRLLVLGSDCAGKTTFLYKLKFGDVQPPPQCFGMFPETVSHKNVTISVMDVGPESISTSNVRPLFIHYLKECNGLVWFVDSADRHSLEDSRKGLTDALEVLRGYGQPLLIFANKSDVAGHLTAAQVAHCLQLSEHAEERRIHVRECSALTGAGLHDGLAWIRDQVYASYS